MLVIEATKMFPINVEIVIEFTTYVYLYVHTIYCCL